MSSATRREDAADVLLEDLNASIVDCRRCPRLVEWRERVAREKRAAFVEQTYWGRPVPSFGDPGAALLIVGLAPAAHGANRTGRMFTGDRSGEWLYRGLHRVGLSSSAVSTASDDGLRLYGTWLTAAVRCAPPSNTPLAGEWDSCRPWLEEELDLLPSLRAVVALGGFAFDRVIRVLRSRGLAVPVPQPRFTHGVEVDLGNLHVLGSFHPSQQNTFTGRLTEAMFDAIWQRAVALLPEGTASSPSPAAAAVPAPTTGDAAG